MPKAEEKKSLILHLLSLEESVKREALHYPDGDNVDAIKSALRNVDAGIGHLRKALKQVKAMER